MKNKILVLSVILFLVPITAFAAHWTTVDSSSVVNLNGVWGSSGSDVFVVGSSRLIRHYNGSTWSTMIFFKRITL